MSQCDACGGTQNARHATRKIGATTMTTYDIYRAENRGGRSVRIGTIEADNGRQALEEARRRHECDATHHLYVSMAGCERRVIIAN